MIAPKRVASGLPVHSFASFFPFEVQEEWRIDVLEIQSFGPRDIIFLHFHYSHQGLLGAIPSCWVDSLVICLDGGITFFGLL